MAEKNLVEFYRGNRYKQTDMDCPMCRKAKLKKDTMKGPRTGCEFQLYKCMYCGYEDYQKDNGGTKT